MAWFKTVKSGDACRPLLDAGPEQTARYRHFRNLLDHNRKALNLMADLEQTYYDNRPFAMQRVERGCARLLSEVKAMIQALSVCRPSRMNGFQPFCKAFFAIQRTN